MKYFNRIFRISTLMLALCLLLGAAALAAEAQPTTVTAEGYTDITGTEYEDDIRVMAAMGLALGYEDNSFHPGRSYTRLETAELVVALLGLEAPADYVSPYTDTVSIAGSEAVDAVTAHDFMSGRSDGLFEPYSGILKSEFISVLSSVAAYLGTEDLISHLDEDLALWAEDSGVVTAAEAMHAARTMITALDAPEVSLGEEADAAVSGEMASGEMTAETAAEAAEASGEIAGEPAEDTVAAETSAEPTAEAAVETTEPETAEASGEIAAEGTVTAEASAEPAAEAVVETTEPETAEASGEIAAEATESSAEPAEAAAGETAPEQTASADASGEADAAEPEAPTGVLDPNAAAETASPADSAASGEAAQPQADSFAEAPAAAQTPEINPDDPGAEIKSSVYSIYQNIRDKLASFFEDLLG